MKVKMLAEWGEENKNKGGRKQKEVQYQL